MQIVFPISDHLLEGSNQDRKSGKKPGSGSRNPKAKPPKSDIARKRGIDSGNGKSRRNK